MIDNSTRDTIDGWMYGSGSGGYTSQAAPSSAAASPAPAAQPQGMLSAATTVVPSYATREGGYDAGAVPSNVYQTAPAQPQSQWGSLAASTIAPTDLTHRAIDPATQTVNGQMQTMMSENSPLLQQAKSDAMRSANERGMLNSTMAASGGTDAMLRTALNVATPDAAYYNHAADYNAAADNQAVMYNADQNNQTSRLKAQLSADEAARASQRYLAQMQDATSRYSTDMNYRQQMEANKKSLVNNIIQNPDISPDRKAAMLEQLGEGTSAGKKLDGTYAEGTGLAGAVYVIDSVTADLKPAETSTAQMPNSGDNYNYG